MVHSALTRAIDEGDWADIDYTDGGRAQVAETTLVGRRLIVRRTRLTGRQVQLFPDWRHHAFGTDRTGGSVELDADHRRHAVVALAIRDFKQGAGLAHCPSGIFNATTLSKSSRMAEDGRPGRCGSSCTGDAGPSHGVERGAPVVLTLMIYAE